MSLIKTDKFAQLLAEYSGVTEEEALSFIKSFSDVISQKVKQGEDVDVQGLGRFILIDTKQAEMRRIALMLADSMKDEVNSPFSFFEPYVITKGNNETDVIHSTKEEENLTESVVVIEEDFSSVSNVVATDLNAGSETFGSVVTIENIEEAQEISEPDSIDSIEEKENKVVDSIKNKSSSATKANFWVWIISCSLVIFVILSFFYFFLNTSVPATVTVEESTSTIIVDGNLNIEPAFADSISANSDSVVVSDDSLSEEPIANVVINDLQSEVRKPGVMKNNLQSEVLISDSLIVNRRLLDSIGNPVIVILQSGERLTLVSLKYFGSKDFWPYVFDVNSDRLKSPSNVQTGMKLFLPDPKFFNIDANSEESLKKAKKRGFELLNK